MKKITKFLTAAMITAAASAAALAVAGSADWLIGGFNETPSSYYSPSSDFNVWVNGKDTKDNAKTPEDETCLNKTGVVQHIAMSAGGKWNVAVTSVTINTPEKFMALLDSKGKLFDPKAAENKLIASAKIKDGEITVTAGKSTGQVNIWAFETNKNGVVYIPTRGVIPVMYTANVKMSPGSPTIAEPEDVFGGVLKAGAKAVTKLSLGLDSSTYSQETKKLMLCDKKEAWDPTSEYAITYANDDKTTTPSVVSAVLDPDKATFYITPIKMGKTTVTFTSVQSGKAAKLSIEVKGKYKVTFDPKLVAVDDMTDKNDPKKVSSGESLVDGTTVRITTVEGADIDQIMAYGKAVKSGGTVKITAADLEITAGKLYNVTVTGADKVNQVLDGTKSVKSGKYLLGAKLTLVLEKGATATVTSGSATNNYTGDGVGKIDIVILGETKIEITKPEKT